MTEKYRDECADYWKERALAPTCQEERDAINKGPKGEGFFMRDDREIDMEIKFVDQEIQRMMERRDRLVLEYREFREKRLRVKYLSDGRVYYPPIRDSAE